MCELLEEDVESAHPGRCPMIKEKGPQFISSSGNRILRVYLVQKSF